MLNVQLSIVDSFFDRQKVLDQVGRENARKLSKAGAFIKTRSRSKLRRRKKTAQAGQPPSVHSRDRVASLKYILFGLNHDAESVVIVPVGLPSRRLRGSSANTVPELMEFGGTAVVSAERKRFSKHPFMGPSLEEEAKAGTIADLWKS